MVVDAVLLTRRRMNTVVTIMCLINNSQVEDGIMNMPEHVTYIMYSRERRKQRQGEMRPPAPTLPQLPAAARMDRTSPHSPGRAVQRLSLMPPIDEKY